MLKVKGSLSLEVIVGMVSTIYLLFVAWIIHELFCRLTGIHKLFHCAPNVPHYAKNKAVGVMKPGHAFTIEPMISEGVWTDQTWPDNWTAVTTDGKLSAQVITFLISK